MRKVAGQADTLEKSLWQETCPPAPDWPALTGVQKAQIAIIGGGYTGLSAALHLAEAGIDTVLMDRHAPGWGASGRNGGQVIAGFKHGPAELEKKYGRAAPALIRLGTSGPDLVFDIIKRHAIACAPRPSGWLNLAHSASALKLLIARAQQWQAAGTQMQILTAADAASLSGAQGYVGGVLDPRGGTLHPLAYARGLATAAARCGARLHANTPVVRLGRTHYGWFVETPEGSVAARKVILATNAYTDPQFDDVRRSIVTLPSFQIASEPLPQPLRAKILPGGQGVSDTRRLLRYFRLDPDGRLIMGGRGSFGQRPAAAAIKRQRAAVTRIFPQAAGIDFPYAWGGLVAMTPDHMPKLHEPAAGMLTGLGYNGRGVAMATVLGRLLASWASGLPWQDLGYPVTKINPMVLHEYSELGAQLAVLYYRLLDRVL